uniref:DDE-1 domain-containing protein n=1 Tax=Pundamilia nyererei TaxID=303518 RepID=A0A3B4FEC3_9CICH
METVECVQIKFLPPNTTSLIQPMDQDLHLSFLSSYINNWKSDGLDLKQFAVTRSVIMFMINCSDSL